MWVFIFSCSIPIAAAHEHAYERMYPVYNVTEVVKSYHNPPYPVYVMNGTAGGRMGGVEARTSERGGAHVYAVGVFIVRAESLTQALPAGQRVSIATPRRV